MAVLRISQPEATVGRNPSSGVVISDPFISRTHALLRRQGHGWTLEVLPRVTHAGLVSRNGREVASGEPVALAAADVLVFGKSPEYEVGFDGDALLLSYRDETERAPQLPDRIPVLAFHPIARTPKSLRAAFDVRGDASGELSVDDVDAVAFHVDALPVARVDDLRARRFFLPIAIVGDPAPRPAQAAVAPISDCWLWGGARDPQLGNQLLTLVKGCREREQAALPYRTGELLHLDAAGGRVLAHDWLKGAPRELRLSELQHQILLAIALAQRQRPGLAGLSPRDVAARLEARGFARSERTVGNELSVRLPQALHAGALHPLLWAVTGTREKTYGLSTPASCLRDL